MPATTRTGPTGSVLVGRDGELHRLVRTVLTPPALVVLEGEAGIGKTRLVAEMAAHRDLAGRRVVVGRCQQIREPFPLGPVLDALRRVGGELTRRRPSPVAGALRPLLPELAGWLPPAPEPLDDRAAERHRVFRALAEVLAALGDVVLVVEDAHWADEQTVDFLGYLLADPPPALSLVVTYREEEVTAAVRTTAARPAPEVTRARVNLGPLDVAQTAELAESVLGSSRPLSEPFATHLWERAAGIPFVVQELVTLLVERGSLVQRGEGWSRRTIEELNVPATVRDSVLERVQRLSERARAVVEAAAVLGDPAPVPVLTAASGLSRDDVVDGLAEALATGLLVERDTTVGFRHVLAAQAVYASVPLPRRQDGHARAAIAVEALQPPPLGRIAHHLREANRHDGWVDAAERAADQAGAAGDDTEATRLLGDVLRTASLDGLRRGELTVRFAWAATQARAVGGVLPLIEQALAEPQPARVRGLLRFHAALIHEEFDPDPDLMRRYAAAAVEDLQDRPDLAAWAMVSLALPYGAQVSAAEHRLWCERSLALVPRIGEGVEAVWVQAKIAMLLVMAGDRRWVGLTDQVVAFVGETPRGSREVGCYSSIVDVACLAGHFAVAERLLDTMAVGRRTHRMDLVQDVLRLVLDHATGAWDDLSERCAGLDAEVRNRPQYRVVQEGVLASLALARGEVRGLDARFTAAIDVALTCALDYLPVLVTGRLRLASGDGQDAARAVAECREALRLWELKSLWPLAVRALPSLVQALTAIGRADAADEADAAVARYTSALAGLDAPFAPAALAHARGLLAAGRGQARRAAAHLTEAAREYDRLPCPYEAAQAREQAVSALLAVGDEAAAGECWEAAVAGYRRLGATGDLDRAGQLAGRLGRRSSPGQRRGRPSYGGELSPRERQIAELAATGLTNREIAQALFVSARTVEGHLTTVLRKLGLRSRTELAHFLGGSAR